MGDPIFPQFPVETDGFNPEKHTSSEQIPVIEETNEKKLSALIESYKQAGLSPRSILERIVAGATQLLATDSENEQRSSTEDTADGYESKSAKLDESENPLVAEQPAEIPPSIQGNKNLELEFIAFDEIENKVNKYVSQELASESPVVKESMRSNRLAIRSAEPEIEDLLYDPKNVGKQLIEALEERIDLYEQSPALANDYEFQRIVSGLKQIAEIYLATGVGKTILGKEKYSLTGEEQDSKPSTANQELPVEKLSSQISITEATDNFERSRDQLRLIAERIVPMLVRDSMNAEAYDPQYAIYEIDDVLELIGEEESAPMKGVITILENMKQKIEVTKDTEGKDAAEIIVGLEELKDELKRTFNIDVVPPSIAGAPYNRSTMEAVERIATSDKTLDQTVIGGVRPALIMRGREVRTLDGKVFEYKDLVLTPEKVKVYIYEPAE